MKQNKFEITIDGQPFTVAQPDPTPATLEEMIREWMRATDQHGELKIIKNPSGTIEIKGIKKP